MKRKLSLLFISLLFSYVNVYCSYRTGDTLSFPIYKIWHFHQNDSSEGWHFPEELGGVVHGGAVWLSFPRPRMMQENRLSLKNPELYSIASPGSIGVPSAKAQKLRMRILNLSPETNGELSWNTRERPDVFFTVPFSVEPYSANWQEVECHLDQVHWEGHLNQIKIKPGLLGMRGDIYIDWIAITGGHPRPSSVKPVVNAPELVPIIEIPGITQADFQMAFDVLNDAIIYENLPVNGFKYPVVSPGASGEGYGSNWWLLDAMLTIPALKWVNPAFCENMVWGVLDVQSQNPDGHIDHYGSTRYRGAPSDVSVLPRCYFEAGNHVAMATTDSGFQEEIYHSLKSYLDWWLTPVKRNEKFGLVTGYHEETFSWPYWRDRESFSEKGKEQINFPGEVAQVDLNVSVVMGCEIVADWALKLGRQDEAEKYKTLSHDIQKAINQYMWNEEKEAYYSFDVKGGKQVQSLISYTFDVFRYGIVPPSRIEKLVEKLTNPELFNWGNIPLTTIAKTDPFYVEWTGDYAQQAWDGDVWSMRNMVVIDGLKDIGKNKLAAELNWKTIQIFNANYAEFLEPEKGEGFGVKRYCWTAAQYIQAIVQNLFGIEYSRYEKRLFIFPHIPEELQEQIISIRRLRIPGSNDLRLNLTVDCTLSEKMDIKIEFDGDLPHGRISVMLPENTTKTLKRMNGKTTGLPALKGAENKKNCKELDIPVQKEIVLTFGEKNGDNE
jgi:hypothetical protein